MLRWAVAGRGVAVLRCRGRRWITLLAMALLAVALRLIVLLVLWRVVGGRRVVVGRILIVGVGHVGDRQVGKHCSDRSEVILSRTRDSASCRTSKSIETAVV